MADQCQKGIDLEPLPGQLPSRGAIEVKSVAADLNQLAASEQVAKYLAKYGQVLVTNYRWSTGQVIVMASCWAKNDAGSRLFHAEMPRYRLFRRH